MAQQTMADVMHRISDGGGLRQIEDDEPDDEDDADLSFSPSQPRDSDGRWRDVRMSVADLRALRPNGDHQVLNTDQVDKYRAAIRAGESLPPLLVEETRTTPFLSDGNHRLQAAFLEGVNTLIARVFAPTDAGQLAALKALNRAHDADLANPSISRTRRITNQLSDGKSPIALLTRRGISRDVADAVNSLVESGTVTRPNARRRGHELSLPIRLERDREALYRGAYVLKAARRLQDAVDAGQGLETAMVAERRYFSMHEMARKHRLDMVTMTQRIGLRFGEKVIDRNGAERTLLGWYLNNLIQNDEECIAADGNNFYAEEGTTIGYPGAVHLNCGCYAGPAHAGAAMVNDVLKSIPTIQQPIKPTFTLKSRKRTA